MTEKVRRRIRCGGIPRETNAAARAASVVLFPEPAPARTGAANMALADWAQRVRRWRTGQVRRWRTWRACGGVQRSSLSCTQKAWRRTRDTASLEVVERDVSEDSADVHWIGLVSRDGGCGGCRMRRESPDPCVWVWLGRNLVLLENMEASGRALVAWTLLFAPSSHPLLLPLRTRQEAALAERALLQNKLPVALTHLNAAILATPASPENDKGMMDIYKRLLRVSREVESAGTPSACVLLDHLAAQPAEGLRPDAATAHLAVTAVLQAGERSRRAPAALELLERLRVQGVPLSSGSFDLVIGAASKARDRRACYQAYTKMRRSGLLPTAYTLNALLNAYIRLGQPSRALELLRRADSGPPRWPGEPPDVWSFGTGMAAARAARQHVRVGQIFARMSNDQALRPHIGPVAFNMAIEARLRLRDRPGAERLLARMGRAGAPVPRTDTFNAMLSVLGERRDPYGWVLREMGVRRVEPDSYTVCTMLRLQTSLATARSVWRWGRQRGAATGVRAWHHFIEAHVRHGQPHRTAALLALAEARDGLQMDSVRSHNLYLRALLASGRAGEAIRHFERMCTQGEAHGEAQEGFQEGAQGAGASWPWLRRRPPAPDAYSFSLALTALRNVSGATGQPPLELLGERAVDANASAASAASPSTRSKRSRQRAQRAALLVQAAEERGALPPDQPPPAAVAHALVSSCGDDLRAAVALWRDFLRPRYLAERGNDPPLFAPPGEPPSSEQAALHALLRVCGAAGRPDEALKVVFAVRKDGTFPDATWYSAYEKGKLGADSGGSRSAARRLLDGGYERLLMLELCPERVDGPRIGGKIERIRIQF